MQKAIKQKPDLCISSPSKKPDIFRSRRTDLNSRRCANRAALRPQDKILTQNSKRKEFFLKNSETPISSVILKSFSRESTSLVMPERFYQASKVFKYFWTPDRGIQGQAKSGSQVAGVTNLRKPHLTLSHQAL